MKIDVVANGVWESNCRKLRAHFGIDPDSKVQLKIYHGISHALFEISQALAQMVPHKQGLAYVENTSPYFEPLMVHFSRSAYELHSKGPEIFQDPAAWVKEALAHSAFFLWNEDDPVTGRIYDTGSLEAQLKDQRIYRIRVSHSAHLRKPQMCSVAPFQIELRSFTPTLCVAIIGERVRFEDGVAPHLPWDPRSADLICELQKVLKENQKLVEEFEQSRHAGLEPLFELGQNRLYDRAAVFWRDIDGSAALEFLSSELGGALAQPGRDPRMESASQCRWDDFHGFQWLKNQSLDANILRGLLILNVDLLTSELPAKLARVREKILAMQGQK